MKKVKLLMEAVAMLAAFPVLVFAELNHGTKRCLQATVETQIEKPVQKDLSVNSGREHGFHVYPMIRVVN
jgi:hypothetical protein